MTSVRPTPFVEVDLARLRRNVEAMARLAAHSGVRLRPHAKTHKSPAIARMQLDAGAIGITCAKIGEAEVFTDAGIGDIRVAYPLHPSNADRVVPLLDRTRLSVVVDDLDVATAWSRAMMAAGRVLDILVKVDVGFHRCGINPDAPGVEQKVARIASLPGLRFRGLLSHAGHAYHAASPYALAAITAHETMVLLELQVKLKSLGVEAEEISVGSTPTSAFAPSQRGITEMRPGNYVFRDRTQVALGAARLDDCSLSIVATVVSRPADDRVILDCGSKTLSSDGARGFSACPGYGAVFANLADATPNPDILIERLSEEHAVTRVLPDCTLRVGDRVRVLPNHACVVANLANELILAENGIEVERVTVAARGKVA